MAVSVIDISQEDVAVAIHYIFMFINPFYGIYGGLHYIVKVCTTKVKCDISRNLGLGKLHYVNL